MVSLRRLGFGIGLLVVVALVFVGYSAWRVHQVQQDLTAAQIDASDLQAALGGGDQTAVDAAVASLKTHSTAASDRTDGATWSILTHVPVFGDDARGVRTLSDVLTSLSGSGLKPLLDASDQLDSIVPKNGRIPVGQLQSLQQPWLRGRPPWPTPTPSCRRSHPTASSRCCVASTRRLPTRCARPRTT